jgi:hypothetical protein
VGQAVQRVASSRWACRLQEPEAVPRLAAVLLLLLLLLVEQQLMA